MPDQKLGMLIVLSGPSGVGKGTLCNMLIENDESITFSTSVTTRAPRDYEVEGVHYFFITDERYDELLKEDAFVEHATVHGHRYGTLKSQISKAIDSGMNVILDIDPQGARTVMKNCPDCVSIFILPPSYETLRSRLHTRSTDDDAEIEKRLNNARGEIEQMGLYDYAVINDDLQTAFEQLTSILNAEKQRTIRFKPDIQ
ncbi:MAG: guanylate kinase [Clostridiales bacterium]|nr:guanylate kinase [Clostridiales bacterium]